MYRIKEFTRENIPTVLAFERELRQECKNRGAGLIIALMAHSDEAQRFYKSGKGAAIHDTGVRRST